MSGALMELVAVGQQDHYLTRDPEITFFQTHHKKYTNFAIESVEQTFTGQIQWGGTATTSVSRSGDLIWKTWIQLDLPKLTKEDFLPGGTHSTVQHVCWTNSVGHAAIEQVTIEIGGTVIDKHYGRWLQIWDELTSKNEHRSGMDEMIGRQDDDSGLFNNGARPKTVYVPLQFWFNRTVGAALPLVALQYHEVKFKIHIAPLNNLVLYLTGSYERFTPSDGSTLTVAGPNVPQLAGMSLYIDFIYLDEEERSRFAQNEHYYLIEQLQQHEGPAIADFGTRHRYKVPLNFNHPVKELIWTVQNSHCTKAGPSYNDWFNFSANAPGSGHLNGNRDLIASASLKLNGHERFTNPRNAKYFRLVQPATHHTRIPSKHIYVYSFGINPEEYQPSGTCNFSRIDNAELFIETADPNADAHNGLPPIAETFPEYTSWSQVKGRIEVFAHSLNILKIKGGLGGLLYAN